MSAVKDITRGFAPYLLLAGVAVVVWWNRGRIADWFRNRLTGGIIPDSWGFDPNQINEPVFGACSTGWRWILNTDNCRNGGPPLAPTDGGTFYPTPNPSPDQYTPGNLNDDIARAYHCSIVPDDPICPQATPAPAPPVTGPGPAPLNEPPAPVDHYSPVWNPGNVDEIIRTHPGITDPLISSYNQVRQYDTNQFTTPHGQAADFYDPATGRYLDISPYGWVVYGLSTAYLGDPPGGRWHNLYGQGGSFGGLTHELPLWV